MVGPDRSGECVSGVDSSDEDLRSRVIFPAPSFFFSLWRKAKVGRNCILFLDRSVSFLCGLRRESYETVAPWPKGRDSLLGSLHGCDNILIPLLLCVEQGFPVFAATFLVRYRRQMVESWRLSYFGCANQCQVLCVWGSTHLRCGNRLFFAFIVVGLNLCD